MDVTPTKKAFEAMSKFIDATAGEAPSKLDRGPGAQKQREKRTMMFDFLHRFYGVAVRHGAAACMQSIQQDMAKAQMRKVAPH